MPHPRTPRASRARRSADGKAATISSNRNCGAAPTGADNDKRISDGQPASSDEPGQAGLLAPEHRGERRRLEVREREVGDTDVDDVAGRPEAGEWDRWLAPPGEDEVGVRRQGADEVGQEAGAGRPVGQLVNVVEHQAHVERGELAEGVEHALQWVLPVAVAIESGQYGADEVAGVAVAGLARDPGVDSSRISLVGPMAWPSEVDFPNPAPATTVVSGTEKRRPSRSSRRGRTTSSGRADGGVGARRPPRGRSSSRIRARRYARATRPRRWIAASAGKYGQEEATSHVPDDEPRPLPDRYLGRIGDAVTAPCPGSTVVRRGAKGVVAREGVR